MLYGILNFWKRFLKKINFIDEDEEVIIGCFLGITI